MSIDRFPTIACILAAGVLAACAAPEQDKPDAYKAPIYRTGSNLPAGRESGEAPPELTAAERRAIEDMQNRPRQPIGVTK